MKPWAGDLFDAACGKPATDCRPYIQLDIQLDKMTKQIQPIGQRITTLC